MKNLKKLSEQLLKFLKKPLGASKKVAYIICNFFYWAKQPLIFLKNSFFEDKESWPLWTPILFSLGIILYLYFPYFNYTLFFTFALIYTAIFRLLRKNYGPLLLLFPLFLIGMGYFLMGYRVYKLNGAKLLYNTGEVEIVGIIEEFLPYEKEDSVKDRIILKVESIQKTKPPFIKVEMRGRIVPYFDENGIMQNTPTKVRVNLTSNEQSAKVGDKIRMTTKLMPLPKKPHPTGYDFERYAYFKQIGAIGYQGNIAQIIEPAKVSALKNLNNKVANFRNELAQTTSNLNILSAGILASLLTGVKAYIGNSQLESLRTSGLTHLIAVSGLHMFVVVGLIMFFTRKLFATSQYLSLNFNTKKWSAILALIGGFGYLAMVGFPVSAQRAYIMISLILLAIIIDKESYSPRSVAFAGLILLILRPEMIINVGFQMSFMAVVGLISIFRLLRTYNITFWTTNKFLKPFYYLGGSFVASLVATLCILPFSIYYFNIFSTYNILANMFAIPLTIFWIMPLILFSFVLMPFGLSKISLIPAGWGANLLLYISDKINAMPSAVHIIASPTKLSMALIISGMLWFLLWSKKWRLLGLPVCLVGILLAFIKPTPDLIVDYKDKIFAITDNAGRLYFSEEPNEYKKEVWMKKMGEETFRLTSEYPHKSAEMTKQGIVVDEKTKNISARKTLQCVENYCLIKKNTQLIYIVKNKSGIKQACTYGDKVINLSAKKIWYCKDMDNVFQRKWNGEEVEVLRL